MPTLADYFDQFVRERTYLNNVTPKTREWYQTAWTAFVRSQRSAPARPTDAPLLTRTDFQHFVVHLRERGVKPISCNCWLRAMNAFAKWLHEQGVVPDLVRLRPLKVEKRLLAIHSDATLRLILGYRPKMFMHWRVWAVACTILDAGCRIDELLTARVSDFDFDNLLLTVVGKGRKQRKVPFSIELRKVLFRFCAGEATNRREVGSDVSGPRWWAVGTPQCTSLSIILGHTEIGTTMKYLHLLTEDLQRPHQSLSILNRMR